MKLDIPYFSQSKKYTCGPAALRMLLAYYGVMCSEDELSKRARTCEKNGTANDYLGKVIEGCGLFQRTFEKMTFDSLQHFIMRGIPVLINYRNLKNKTGHYAVVVDYNKDAVVIQDPEYGKDISIPHNVFEEHWVSGDEKYTHWGMVVSPEQI